MYSTEAQFRSASPFKNTTNITTGYVTQIIAEADGMIDGKIGEVYQLPLVSPYPPLLEMLSIKIACYLMYKDQNMSLEINQGVNVEVAFNEALKVLEAIRLHQLKLWNASGDEYAINQAFLPSFYPTNASSDPNSPDNTASRITMDKRF